MKSSQKVNMTLKPFKIAPVAKVPKTSMILTGKNKSSMIIEPKIHSSSPPIQSVPFKDSYKTC